MLSKREYNDQNFWISYADLMAGLLFVFILVLGAIVVKTVLIQSDLHAIKTDLQKQKEALKISEEELAKKKQKVRELAKQLLASQQDSAKLSMKISLLESQIDKLVENLEVLQIDIEKKAKQMMLTQTEMDSLKALLLEQKKQNNQLQSDLNATKKMIDKQDIALHLKESEIAQLEKALLLKTREYQQVVEDLNITKTKIKHLTGIKLKVVKALKDKLGDQIHIDTKSGAIRFASNILFNQGEYKLKPTAKRYLKQTLSLYFDTLLKDKNIVKYIDTIVIEGHTNSDGSYMYNLNLSQKRAFAVMEFMYREFPRNRVLLQKYITASGRSYSEPVVDKNGKEDKDASRRIEVKFYIKSNEAIDELKRYLGE